MFDVGLFLGLTIVAFIEGYLADQLHYVTFRGSEIEDTEC